MKFRIGDVVEYVDEVGRGRPALITAIHGGEPYGEVADDEEEHPPSLNLVFVSHDDAMKDPYGRQIGRETSVTHDNQQSAHGMLWRALSA